MNNSTDLGWRETVILIWLMTRPIMCGLTAFTVVAGHLVAWGMINIMQVCLAAASQFLLVGAVFLFNDVFDKSKDQHSMAYKPLAMGLIDFNTVLYSAWSLLASSIICASMLSPSHAFYVAVQATLGIPFYSLLKSRSGFTANILTAALFSSTLWFGAIPKTSIALMMVTPVFFLFLVAREILKDVYDYEADLLAGVRSLPVLRGQTLATCLASWLMAAAGLLLLSYSLVVGKPVMFITAFFVLLSILFLVYRLHKPRGNIRSMLTYSIIPMVLGIISLLWA